MSDASVQSDRGRWGTKLGFMLAAMGSAIGLGNIWRFPYVVYSEGGGAFLLPYFIAIATAAIPILILEYTLGHKYGYSAPFTFRAIARRWEALGWFQVAVTFVIGTYYMVILGWCLSYIVYSFGSQWGEDTEAFFLTEYLGVTDSFWNIGGIQLQVLIPLLIAWVLVYLVLLRGVSRGIELLSKVLMPTLIVMLVIIVVRAITLEGAALGLDALFTPDFGALTDPTVWIAAYGQVFFSTSIAFSVMIVYASYLPRNTDLSNSAFIVGLSNASFEFLAAIGVFSVLGFLAVAQSTPVDQVASDGPGLAFITFPLIINTLPALNTFFGVLFFATLFFAGITSAVSIMEVAIAPLREKFALSRAAAVNTVCGLAALISIAYVTPAGLYFLDTVDHFVNNFGLVVGGLLEVILIAWVVRQIDPLSEYINGMSYIRAGAWWKVSLMVITPVLLTFMTLYNLWEEFKAPYEGYPVTGLVVMGGGAMLLIVLAAVILPMVRDRGQVFASDTTTRG